MRKRARDLAPGDIVCLPRLEVITVTRVGHHWTKLYGPTAEVHYHDGFAPTYIDLPAAKSVAVRETPAPPVRRGVCAECGDWITRPLDGPWSHDDEPRGHEARPR